MSAADSGYILDTARSVVFWGTRIAETLLDPVAGAISGFLSARLRGGVDPEPREATIDLALERQPSRPQTVPRKRDDGKQHS